MTEKMKLQSEVAPQMNSKDESGEAQSASDKELATLNNYINEKTERMNTKISLRDENQRLSEQNLTDSQMSKLDSSIKKVTAFIKRLKTLTESQKETLSKEMSQLNLSKYLSEVAAAFTEAKLKMNDIPCALHLCSQMHQNYAEFSGLLFEQWQKLLNIKKDEKITNPSKLRVDLRFFAELITIGVLNGKDPLSLLGNQLTVLTKHDEEHANIAIISSFCKNCGEDFAGLIPTKYEQLAIKHNIEIPRNTIFSSDRQKAVRHLFKEYFRSLSQHIINENKEIQKQERSNKKSYQTKGELHTDKKDKYEQILQSFKKLTENAEIFADLLNEKMPDLPMDEIKKEDDIINIDIYTPGGRCEEFDSNTSPWEDEETRQFYENIPDLRVLVPGILYKDSTPIMSKDKTESVSEPVEVVKEETDLVKERNTHPGSVNMDDEMAQIEKEIQELENQVDESNPSEEQEETEVELIIDEKEAEEEMNLVVANTPVGATTTLASSNMKALMDIFIAQLPNCVNRELIDKAAKEFLLNLNTKLNRKRLVSALFQVQRTRLDLLPFYSRFLATLNPCMPEISTDLASLLHNDFRFHVRKKDQINIESKIKTARFIGELVKFDMFSKLDALNCLKTLLADFKHHNIEMGCNLLDVCGRYLYRSQESHQKLKLLLEILMRKKKALQLDGRYSIMIENAFYYCNPPENKQVEKKVKSPIHEYIKKLLYKDLNKLCVEKILRQMRRINWDDEDLNRYAVKCLTAAWNVRYNSIHCLANLVSGLALYHEEIGIHVVDAVIEDIRLGLEVNLPKFNQRRVSMIKYLGELYNYRMVESSIIFKVLYMLITYGVSFDPNDVTNIESLDPCDNFFRVRLVCVMLDTCGQYFDRGNTKKKLDCFLIYFQRYYLFKKETAMGDDETKPSDRIDVEFTLTESITSLRPSFKFVKNHVAAIEAVLKMENEIRESLNKTAPGLLSEVCTNKDNDDGLHVINEDEEEDHYRVKTNDDDDEREDDYDDDDDEDVDDEDSYNTHSNSKKTPYKSLDADEAASYSMGSNHDEIRQRSDSQALDSNSEVEDSVVNLKPREQKKEVDQEDEEFVKMFETLLSENIAQRNKESIKMPTVDISVPMHLRKIKQNSSGGNELAPEKVPVQELKGLQYLKSQPKQEEEEEVVKTANISSKKQQFNFVIMSKKNNKPQYHNMNVPISSAFANQFRAREEAEKVEKEKLKQLTLNINQRIEQEELQEMINQSKMSFYASANTNRERHQKYNHPKGAPDVDLIFGGGGSVNVGFNSSKRQNNSINSLNVSSPGDMHARTTNEMNKNFPNISSNNPNNSMK